MKKQSKKNKKWTNGKSVGKNKKFYEHNLNELNETLMKNYPNLVINSTLFSNMCNENTNMNVFSIMRNGELFFLGEVVDQKTKGGELHLRKANDYEQEDLCIEVNCEAALCVLCEYVLYVLNFGCSVGDLHTLLFDIGVAETLIGNCQAYNDYYEKKVA